MTYTPDAYDATNPTDGIIAETATAEFRAIKSRLNTSTKDLSFGNFASTPGNVSAGASLSGTAAFATGTRQVTITSTVANANSVIQCQLAANDSTLTFIQSIVPSAGSFQVFGNANATSPVAFNFLIWNSN